MKWILSYNGKTVRFFIGVAVEEHREVARRPLRLYKPPKVRHVNHRRMEPIPA